MARNKNMGLWFVLIIIGLFFIGSLSGSTGDGLQLSDQELQSIYERAEYSFEDCNDKRLDSLDRGYLCVGTCKQVDNSNVHCDTVGNDDFGGYGFFRERDVSCNNLDAGDRDIWECFYGTGVGGGQDCGDPLGQTCSGTNLIDACGDHVIDCADAGMVCGLGTVSGVGSFNFCQEEENNECSRSNLAACDFNDQVCIDDQTACSRAEFIDGEVFCSPFGDYIDRCASGTSCSGGTCVVEQVECVAGQERCNNGVRQECQNNRYVDTEFCSSGCVELGPTQAQCQLDETYYCLSGGVDCTTIQSNSATPPTGCYDSLTSCESSRHVYCVSGTSCEPRQISGDLPSSCFVSSTAATAQASCESSIETGSTQSCQSLSSYGNELSLTEIYRNFCVAGEDVDGGECLSFSELQDTYDVNVPGLAIIDFTNIPLVFDVGEELGVCVELSTQDEILAFISANYLMIILVIGGIVLVSLLK